MDGPNARLLRRLDVSDADRIRGYVSQSPINARILCGMTREQAAKELGISFYALSAIENGKGEVTLRVARKMEKIYGRSMDEMFPVE